MESERCDFVFFFSPAWRIGVFPKATNWVFMLGIMHFMLFHATSKPYETKSKIEKKPHQWTQIAIDCGKTREMWTKMDSSEWDIHFPVCRIAWPKTERKAKVIPWPGSVIAVRLSSSSSFRCRRGVRFSLSLRLYNTVYAIWQSDRMERKVAAAAAAAGLKQMENAIYTALNANEWRQRIFQRRHRRHPGSRSLVQRPAILFVHISTDILCYCCTTHLLYK